MSRQEQCHLVTCHNLIKFSSVSSEFLLNAIIFFQHFQIKLCVSSESSCILLKVSYFILSSFNSCEVFWAAILSFKIWLSHSVSRAQCPLPSDLSQRDLQKLPSFSWFSEIFWRISATSMDRFPPFYSIMLNSSINHLNLPFAHKLPLCLGFFILRWQFPHVI